MSTADIEFELNNEAESCQVASGGWRSPRKTFRCHIALVKEDDGSYSAIVLNLPGAGSCGDTEEDALINVREAVSGVVESHLDAGEAIPWVDSSAVDISGNAKLKWILVHV